MLSMLGQGFGVTLQIFFLTLVGSLPLGVVVALARMSRVKPIAWIMKFYISVMRGTPLMLQMFFIYFAPYYIFGILRNDRRVHHQLRGLLRRDLPQRHPVDSARTVRGRRGLGLLASPDVYENRAAPGD